MANDVFTPSLCDGEKYKGTVTFRPMNFDERLDLYDSLGLGEYPEDPKAMAKFAIKSMAAIGKKSHEFIVACDIERLGEAPYKYASWKEVYEDGDLVPLVVEVCKRILGKITKIAT